jgi:phosphoglycolate phosphatase-like HAD superfamily hydrolase
MKGRLSLLFDFDGTLADTRPHIIRLFNVLARRYGFRRLDEDDPGLRDLTMLQLLQRLGVSIARVPALVREVRDQMRAVMPEVRPFDGVVDTLHALRQGGVELGLVTSNERANVDAFAERHALPPFRAVATGSSLFGKARLIKKVARRVSGGGRVYYVGDEARDIEAAQRATVGTIAVSWGFNSRELLARLGPDHLVDDPRQLVELVRALELTERP